MSEPNMIMTSLEVGFANGELPASFVRYRGRATRAIAAVSEFPFDDAQFDVVIIESSAVNRDAMKEAHRVLKSDGRLYFIVPEKTSRQSGFTLPELYQLMRDGFNLVSVERPHWWRFGRDGHTLTICATKKHWRTYRSLIREGTTCPLSPFQGAS